MHIRLNVPPWSADELISGFTALVRRGTSHARTLEGELVDFARPWGRSVQLVSSASAGLVLAIKALPSRRARVAVPAYVCPSVHSALVAAEADSILVDTEPDSIRFSLECLTAKVRQGSIDAILAPNTYGLDQDIHTLAGFGVPLIEDAAYQAGRYDAGTGTPCGLRGDFGVWSFTFKSLCSTGGGVLFRAAEFLDADISVERPSMSDARTLLDYAFRTILGPHVPRVLPGAEPPENPDLRRWRVAVVRGITEVQAAIALAQWTKRSEIHQRQSKNLEVLMDSIRKAGDVRPLTQPTYTAPVHFLPLLMPKTNHQTGTLVGRFRQAMYLSSVQTDVGYPLAVGPDRAPNATSLASRLVLVPCSASHSEGEIRAIAAAAERASAAVAGTHHPC
jgi:dTDP-4-amino-4,6-dideoxygalactose transaminase